ERYAMLVGVDLAPPRSLLARELLDVVALDGVAHDVGAVLAGAVDEAIEQHPAQPEAPVGLVHPDREDAGGRPARRLARPLDGGALGRSLGPQHRAGRLAHHRRPRQDALA